MIPKSQIRFKTLEDNFHHGGARLSAPGGVIRRLEARLMREDVQESRSFD